ncbi:unnamed protein product [Umbelopsis ramanniana]
MLALQAEAQAVPAALTVTMYTTITQYEHTGAPHAKPTAGPDGEDMEASASLEDGSAAPSATGSVVASKVAKESGLDASESAVPTIERIADGKEMKPTGAVNPGVSVSSSGTALFTFTPLTLAPEKSKAMASASKLAMDPRPSVTRPNTSGADVLSASKLAVAAIAAVAGLAVL